MNSLDIPKSSNQDIQNEVQDFSMSSKKLQSVSSPAPTQKSNTPGNKLDDTLSKLMKRKNCVSLISTIKFLNLIFFFI